MGSSERGRQLLSVGRRRLAHIRCGVIWNISIYTRNTLAPGNLHAGRRRLAHIRSAASLPFPCDTNKGLGFRGWVRLAHIRSAASLPFPATHVSHAT